MALTVVHATQSAVTDQGESGVIGPSEWNESHTVTGSLDFSDLTGTLDLSSVGSVDISSASHLDILQNMSGVFTATSLTGLISLTQVSDVDTTGASHGDVLTLQSGVWLPVAPSSSGVSDGDKGDITVSGSGAVWTIDADTVTYDKMQDTSATDVILGRSTAGAGTVEEIACTSAGRAILDDADAATQLATLGALGQGLHTIVIPAGSMLPSTTSGAVFAQIETSTNKQNFRVLDFDASADEYAHFQIPMPKSWDEGTITFRVRWTTSATDTDGVAWGLQAVALSDNEAIDASWGTPVVVTDDAQSAANECLTTSASAAVTIAGTPAAGDLTFFRFFRDVSDANDVMTEDARLISVEIFYTIDAATDA